MDDVERFLAALRQGVPDARTLFQFGHCWELFCILRRIWPEAEPWSLHKGDHILTRIDGTWYDIEGKYTGSMMFVTRCTADQIRAWKPHRWAPRCWYRVMREI